MREIYPNNPSNVELPKRKEKDEAKGEREGEFNIDVFVTDHSPDNPDTGSPEKLRRLYKDVARDGVDRVRYDFHWGKLENQPGEFDSGLMERYEDAKRAQEESGLEEPIIILSNPPKWAVEIYKQGEKEEFFEFFKEYVEEVKEALKQAGGKKITTVQILNELNNKQYTLVAVADIPRLCQITREVFKDYNPNLKLMATVNANSLAKFVGSDAKEFLPELKKIKGSFDRIAIDNYPGTWHFPSNAGLDKDLDFSQWPPTKGVFKQLVKQLDYLKEVLEEVATWDVDYDIGEVGLPSKLPWGGEKSQRYFYDAFFRELKHLLVDFRKRGLKLPSAVGLYEAIDEPPRNLMGKILDKTPYPEHRFGMRTGEGDRKMVLRGRQGKEKGPSQLSKIIEYLRAPMRGSKDIE